MIDPINLLNALPGLLIFKIGAREFCMDISSVQIILNMAVNEDKLVRAEGDRKISYLDADYYLIDTSRLFNAAPAKATGTKIILYLLFGKRLGIMVDQIVEFISLDALFIEKNIDFNMYKENKYVSWYLDYQGRKILYPNYERISKDFHHQGLSKQSLY
jgi:chemotaxis signal transduction protein